MLRKIELGKRLDELSALVADMKASEQYPHDLHSFAYYREYESQHVLPFAGGYAEQPNWFIEDVGYFRLIEELENLPYDIQECDENLAKES